MPTLCKNLIRKQCLQKKLIDYFNSFCYVNLLILSIIYHNNRRGRVIAVKVSVSIAFVQFLCVLTYHTINTLLEIPYLRISLTQGLKKYPKLGKVFPFDSQEIGITMYAMTTHTTPTSTEIGLRDSKDASAAEITEHEVEQSLTTRWEETDSLREPLLQELNA